MDLELEVDAGGDTPSLALKAVADDVNPWREEQENGKPEYEGFVNADYDLDLSLNASGKSVHELAPSAEGDIYLTIEDGWLRRSLVDLLFIDLAGWSINFVKSSKYAPMPFLLIQRALRLRVKGLLTWARKRSTMFSSPGRKAG